MFVTILFLAVLLTVMLTVGYLCRKSAANVEGFVLGGRNVGPWITAFAFGTSYFSAVIFVGYAGQFGWNFGLASTWIGLGNAFIGSMLAWNFLGRRTRLMTRHLSSSTMPDFFEKRYHCRSLKTVASLIVFVFLIPYTASLYNGLSSLFALAFDIPYYWCILAMAALTCIYVIFGGYMASAINDFIQGLIMLVGIVAVVGAVLKTNGGLASAVATLSAQSAQTAGGMMQGAYTSFLGPDPLSLLFVVILTSLGTWGLPQMVGKFYSIRNEDAIAKGTVISTVFALIVAGGCYFLGGFGRLYDIDVASLGFDAIIPRMLTSLDSDVIVALVIVLVLSASMSTLSSLVLTSASSLTLDLVVPACRKKPLTEKGKVTVMRVFIAFFVLLSAVIAIVKDACGFTFIAQMMGVSWGALAGSFLAPFLYGLYWKRSSPAAVWASFAFGICVTLLQLTVSLFSLQLPGVLGYLFASSIRSGAMSMVGGLVLVPVVSLLSRKPEAAAVEEIFSCYADTVPAKVTEHLGE